MSESLDLGPESGANSRLAVLRQLNRELSPLALGEPLVEGVHFNADPSVKSTIAVASRPGMLMSAKFDIESGAQWLALHISMSDCVLEGKMLLGIAIRSSAAQSLTYRVCLRNGHEGGFDDIFFRKTVIAYAEPGLHLDALSIAEHPVLAASAPWRDAVLFFRPESSKIELQDLRFFAI